MEQHTWFYKSKSVYEMYINLNLVCESIDDLDDRKQLSECLDKLYEFNEVSWYHDAFRTNKRNPDNTYLDEVIGSKDEWDKWLEENKEVVYDLQEKWVIDFWEKYPNGLIKFG